MEDVLDGLEPAEGTAASSAQGSALARLRERREAIAAERTEVFPVPGYGGELALVARPISWDDAKKVAVRVEKSKSNRKELLAQMDTIILATSEIVLRDPETGKTMPLDPESDTPATFATEVVDKVLGFTANTARERVSLLFNNDLAVSRVCNEINEWMSESGDEVNKEFLGES